MRLSLIFLSFLVSYSCWAKKVVLTLGATKHFANEATEFSKEMEKKGYKDITIKADDKEKSQKTLAKLEKITKRLVSGDKLVISLQCHGGVNKNSGHRNKEKPENHFCCINEKCTNYILTKQIIEAVKELNSKGVEVAVMDNSCKGGSTVLAFQRALPNVCTLSSATADSPGLTGFPNFSFFVKDATDIEQLAIHGSRQIYTYFAKRSHQRVYYTGCAEHTMDFRNYLFNATIHSYSNWRFKSSPFLRKLFELKGKGKKTLDKIESLACSYRQDFHTAWYILKDNFLKVTGDIIFKQLFEQKFEDIYNAYNTQKIEGLPQDLNLEKIVAKIINTADQAINIGDKASGLLNRLAAFDNISLSPEQSLEVEEIKYKLQEIQAQLNQLNKNISPILGIYEELFCETQPSPCRDFQL